MTRNLYVAFELSKNEWKLGFSDGLQRRPRIVSVEARDLKAPDEAVRLRRILERALEVDPNERFDSVRVMLEAIETREQQVPARRAGLSPIRRLRGRPS